MRLLSAADVRAALSMPAAIAAVREGFIALSTGQATVPVRTSLDTPGGVVLYMPAYIAGSPYSVVKIVSVYGGNPAKGLPTVIAQVLVQDASTGKTLAMMDGTSLTAIRTGAASGLATDLLALPDADVLAVLGAGVQARTQIEAVCAVRPIRMIRIYSPNNANRLADELRTQGSIEIVVATTPEEALKDAKVVVAATNSASPVVHAAHLMPGAHINGVGSFTPSMQEIAADVILHAQVVVDHRPSAWAEAGDLLIPAEQKLLSREASLPEIGEIAAGLRQGRQDSNSWTVFKSVGNAVQDAATAAVVYQTALKQSLGIVS